MGVLLQAFYKTLPNNAVPSPADGGDTHTWWWDHLAAQANDLRLAGFTAVWLPPALKTSSGAGVGSDGYGPFDDYDIGSRTQKGSTPTRFGTREQLQRCAAILRANGLDIYLDMVEHHRSGDGDPPFVFRYPGADGTPAAGRFPKDPSNFLPAVPRDPNLGGSPADDAPFGRELAPINAEPRDYVRDNLIAAADWLTRAVDAQGYRLDDVKGLSTDFLLPFLNARSMAGKFAVGEFFDGNRVLVNGWISNPRGMQGRPSAFDFPLKFVLNAMCNNPGRFNMADLDHVGLAGIAPANAVTFVENHDTDLSPSDRIVTNKLLGYAYILTSEGYPCVYYRDYSTDRDCYGLKPFIDNLVWIHENLAAGATQQRWMDFDVFAFERLGGPQLLVALNNDPGAAHTITVATGFGANVSLHDYTGHGPDLVTDGGGGVTLTVPANNNGMSYVCYSRQGQGAPFAVNPLPATQVFQGAADLDILPAVAGKTVTVGRIWCQANMPIRATLAPNTEDWTATTRIKLDILAPDETVLASQTVGLRTPTATPLDTTAAAEGFHTLQVTASATPPANANPAYSLTVRYSATRTLESVVGKWSDVKALKNVPIHAHLLPNGKLLYWGRRSVPGSGDFTTLNQHFTVPFLWDPATGTDQEITPGPKRADGTTANLFCSGHTLLADGRVMVMGGHEFDSQGVNQACVFDHRTNAFTALPQMNGGRWYPTAVTLPDGGVFVCSGSMPTGPLQPPTNANTTNNIGQIWDGNAWKEVEDFNGKGRGSLPLFPRLHVAPDGRVYMAGPNAAGFFLDPNTKTWSPGPTRAGNQADYAPSVMYDAGKIIFIGGGVPPVAAAETIDLNDPAAQWQPAGTMNAPRRQHNATVLPDGTVLVTGGTRGNGFNDLDVGGPVHDAELWDPKTNGWQKVVAESVDRCYHSVAVLLPDGTVFSGGGGEYAPTLGVANPAKDTRTDYQIYSPPYIFQPGARPTITDAPPSVNYGDAFDVGVADPAQIDRVSWIRLASVTHSFDQNQRLNFLKFTSAAGSLKVTAPASPNVCPPGHYMLFVLNKGGVPSIARIVQITAAAPAARPRVAAMELGVINVDPAAKAHAMAKNAAWPPVVVGITPTCPYGLSACWGGAHEALERLAAVKDVSQIVDPVHSTALVYLQQDVLPNITLWRQQFAELVHAAYVLRGVEMTLSGTIQLADGQLTLRRARTNESVVLIAIDPHEKIQWDLRTKSLWPVTPDERTAFDRLLAVADATTAPPLVSVTGPLLPTSAGFVLQVRLFQAGVPRVAVGDR